jgi:hypothetical protein
MCMTMQVMKLSQNNNYLFDKKKVKLFFTVFFRVLKTALFSTKTKKTVEKVVLFLSDKYYYF